MKSEDALIVFCIRSHNLKKGVRNEVIILGKIHPLETEKDILLFDLY